MMLFLIHQKNTMKKVLLLSVSTLLLFSFSDAQLKRLFKKDSTGKNGLDKIIQKTPNKSSGSLTNDEVISGLKEALETGTKRGTEKLSAVDGFFKDAVIKILMPPEAKKAEQTLRNVGLGKQ